LTTTWAPFSTKAVGDGRAQSPAGAGDQDDLLLEGHGA